MPKTLTKGLSWLLPVALLACAGLSCQRQRSFGKPELLATIQDERVRESSGVAPSRIEDGVFFTHNDSGDKPRLFRFGNSGKVLAEIEVAGAEAVDWEDMASAVLDGKPYLFVGDIGNNLAARKEVVVYRIPETTSGSVRPDRVYKLRFPGKPVNSETLLIHPMSGSITIVGKSSDGPAPILRVSKLGRSGTYDLVEVGRLEVAGPFRQARMITGGSYSPDGRHVALRTYLGAFEYDAFRGDWWSSEPRSVRLAIDPQGEAITYARSGDALITTSEGSPCPVTRIPVEQ